MVSFQYKGRVHKSKLSMRAVRYALTDKLARVFPALQRRWLFPVEGLFIEDRALEKRELPSLKILENLPTQLTALGVPYQPPLQIVHTFYRLTDVTVTGWAGAMMQEGLLIETRPHYNWVSALRPEPYRLRALPADRCYFNMMAPVPARGHMFHWLYDAIIPLMAFLENAKAEGKSVPIGLVVNANASPIQKQTLAFIQQRYEITDVQTLAQREAVRVPQLWATMTVPYDPRGLQSPLGLAQLEDLATFLAQPSGISETGPRKKLYISRSDARLRRIINEDEIMPVLQAAGFERVILKGKSIADQVRLFAQADWVIGPHGAGFAHLTWCRPGTKFIEFFPDPTGSRRKVRNASADFWLICKTRGLEYRCCYGSPVKTKADGFEIGLDMLKELLR